MTTKRWNPYYVAFALAHGRGVEDMIETERKEWPGGQMAGFQLWMSHRWSDFRREFGFGRDTPLWDHEVAKFAGWLHGHAFRVAESLSGPVSSHETIDG